LYDTHNIGLTLCQGRKNWTYRVRFLIRQTVKNNRWKKLIYHTFRGINKRLLLLRILKLRRISVLKITKQK